MPVCVYMHVLSLGDSITGDEFHLAPQSKLFKQSQRQKQL